MKHAGKARKAAFKLILISFILVSLMVAVGIAAWLFGTVIAVLAPVLVGLWVLFGLFTLYFFRDPTPSVPSGSKLVLSPAHGKVDVIETWTEEQVMGGECQRISIFLSVFNVHVQNAPVTGKVLLLKETEGKFLNAMKTESAIHNENVLMGFQTREPAPVKIGVRLIAGVLARRIVPFIVAGDEVAAGDRISLIQFGSRADVYLPRGAKIRVKLGDKVVGGETVLADLE
jgi:phosphatidylserine decarboxylase